MRQLTAMAFLLVWLGISQTAHTHARLADSNAVPPRSTNAGIKTGPCGGIAIANTSLAYAPGATLTINWIETIQHPGNYFIEFSAAGDTNWVRLKTVADDKNGTSDLPHTYTTTVTLPNTPCTDCSLRLIQEMTDRNPPTYYYSCSNRFTVSTPTGGSGGGSSGGGTSGAPDTYGDEARNAQETCH